MTEDRPAEKIPDGRPAGDAPGEGTASPTPAEPAGDAPGEGTAPATAAEPTDFWIRPDAAPPPPPPPGTADAAAYAGLPNGARGVVTTALDLLTQASADLRRGSFYIGLIVLLLATPVAVLVWRAAVSGADLFLGGAGASDEATAFGASVAIAGVMAGAGFLVASIESRAVAVSILAGRIAGRPFDLAAAVQRSRTVFWRLAGALILVNLPLGLFQAFLEDRSADLFGGPSEPAVLSAAILVAVLFSPLAFVVTGIVLGDVGPATAIRRSLDLFRARKSTAVVVALFEFGSQLLTAYALLAGLDLVLRGVEVTGVSGSDAAGAVLVVILLFATGTLVFTVSAISITPQVVSFLALTHSSPGLDRIGGEATRFRWLPRSMLAVIVVGALAMFGGLSAIGGTG